jgi:hypothetical protein
MSWEPLTQHEKEAVIRFRKIVGEQMHVLDPEHVENWHSLAFGFFLAHDLPWATALEAARKVGHCYGYWTDFS